MGKRAEIPRILYVTNNNDWVRNVYVKWDHLRCQQPLLFFRNRSIRQFVDMFDVRLISFGEQNENQHCTEFRHFNLSSSFFLSKQQLCASLNEQMNYYYCLLNVHFGFISSSVFWIFNELRLSFNDMDFQWTKCKIYYFILENKNQNQQKRSQNLYSDVLGKIKSWWYWYEGNGERKRNEDDEQNQTLSLVDFRQLISFFVRLHLCDKHKLSIEQWQIEGQLPDIFLFLF